MPPLALSTDLDSNEGRQMVMRMPDGTRRDAMMLDGKMMMQPDGTPTEMMMADK